MIDIKIFKQTDDSRCGAACVKMVLSYYNIEQSEDYICNMLNHSYELGCTNEDIERVLISFGLNCVIKERAEIDDIAYHISKGVPVIIDWYACDPPDGHSSIITGIDNDFVYLADPLYDEIRNVCIEDFYRNWFDFKETPISENNLTIRYMCAVYGNPQTGEPLTPFIPEDWKPKE